MNTIGERVKKLREDRGWSQDELVEEMDIELPVISINNLENNRVQITPPNLRYLPELARTLETNFQYLLDGKSLSSVCIDRFVSNKEKDLYVVGVDKGDKLELPDNATIQAKVTRVLD